MLLRVAEMELGVPLHRVMTGTECEHSCCHLRCRYHSHSHSHPFFEPSILSFRGGLTQAPIVFLVVE